MKHILYIVLGISIFSCSLPTEPTVEPQWSLEIQPRLDTLNNYYILPLNDGSLQTIHRISGRILKDGEPPHPQEKVGWESSHYWVLGDTLGYYIRRVIHNGEWVNVDTTFIPTMGGGTVPTINPVSYSSSSNGEVNTIIAPIRHMRGDTMIVRLFHREGERTISIILQ